MSFFQLLRYIRKTQILMAQQYQDMINQVCHLAYDFLLIFINSRQCNFYTFFPDFLCDSPNAVMHELCCVTVAAPMVLPVGDDRLQLADESEAGQFLIPVETDGCAKMAGGSVRHCIDQQCVAIAIDFDTV